MDILTLGKTARAGWRKQIVRDGRRMERSWEQKRATPRTLSVRELAAWHEAGHAVAYLSKGYVFDSVDIEPGILTKGRVRAREGEVIRIQDQAEIAACGPEAEARAWWLHQDPDEPEVYFAEYRDGLRSAVRDDVDLDPESLLAVSDDLVIARAIEEEKRIARMAGMPDDFGQATEEEWSHRAGAIMLEHWTIVEAVAAQLLERDRLSYHDCRRLAESLGMLESLDD